MIHLLEDHYVNDDESARKARLKYLGYEMDTSGDHLVDRWEKQVAKGEIPDLDQDEPENAKIRDAKIREASQRYYELTGERVYIAPPPDSAEQFERDREMTAPDMEQVGDLVHLAAAGDHDALMMLADIRDDQNAREAGTPVKRKLQTVPLEDIPWDSPAKGASLPDSIDFSNLDEVDWSSIGNAEMFRIAGRSSKGRESATDAFSAAESMGLFDEDDD